MLCTLLGPGGSPGRPSLHPFTVGATPGGCELTAGRNRVPGKYSHSGNSLHDSGLAQSRAVGTASPPARRSGLHPRAQSIPREARRAISPPCHALEQGYGAGVKNTSSGGCAVSLTSGVTLGKSLSAQASVCFLTEPSALRG